MAGFHMHGAVRALAVLGACFSVAVHPAMAGKGTNQAAAPARIGAYTRTIESVNVNSRRRALAFMARGRAYLKLGRKQQGIADLSNALWLDSLSARIMASIHFIRGSAYADQKLLDAALEDMNESIRLHRSAAAFARRGQILLQADKPALALADLNRALDMHPGPRPEILTLRARAYLKLGQKQAAKATLAQALRARPGYRPALMLQASLMPPAPDNDVMTGSIPPAAGNRGNGWRSATRVMPAGRPSRITTPRPDFGPAVHSLPLRSSIIPSTTLTPGRAPGAYSIQLSAHRSLGEAKTSLQRIAARYAPIMAGNSLYVERFRGGARGTVYRVRLGPFRSAELPGRLCRTLKQSGQDCFVSRR